MCPLCYKGVDYLIHLVFYCHMFSDKKGTSQSTMLPNSQSGRHKSDQNQTVTALVSSCPASKVSTCCKYSHNLYRGPATKDGMIFTPFFYIQSVFFNCFIKWKTWGRCMGIITSTPDILPQRPLTWNRNKYLWFYIFLLEFGGVGNLHTHQNRRVLC